MMSSVSPSTKNSCSGSPLMLAKGSTATVGLTTGWGVASPASSLSLRAAWPASPAGCASSATRHTRTGRERFFSVFSPSSSKATSIRSETCS